VSTVSGLALLSIHKEIQVEPSEVLDRFAKAIGGFNGWPHVQWPTRPLPKEAPEAPREVCSGGL